MARSYSMQTAVAIAVVWLLWRWLRRGSGAAPACLAILALLYTHYVPGLAILGAFTLVAWRRIGVRAAALFLLAAACGYLPWLLALVSALSNWIHALDFSSNYAFTGSPWLEPFLKLGYACVSLTIGESFHVASLLLAPVILVIMIAGARRFSRISRTLVAMLTIAGAAGFLGVAHWVSYAFVAARLLWMLPFLALAATAGLPRKTSVARMVTAAVAVSFATSIVFYFDRAGFLDKGYIAPVREIAAHLNAAAKPGDVVLIDAYNTDAAALTFYLGDAAEPIELYRSNEETVLQSLQDANTVWIVRNQRDISPQKFTTRMELRACEARKRTQFDYLPYDPWQRAVLGFLKEPETHFYEMVRCSPRSLSQ